MRTNAKELKKQLEEEFRSTTPRIKRIEFSSEAFYKFTKKGEKYRVHTLTTLLNKKTKVEVIAEIERIFAETAAEFNVDVDKLIIDGKPDYVGISYERDETDKEYDDRIGYLVNAKMRDLKSEQEYKLRCDMIREKKIKQLEAELAELKSIKSV